MAWHKAQSTKHKAQKILPHRLDFVKYLTPKNPFFLPIFFKRIHAGLGGIFLGFLRGGFTAKVEDFTAKVTPDGAKVTTYNMKVTPDGAKVTPYNAKVTPDGAKVTTYSAKVTPYNMKVTPDGAKVTTYSAKVTPYNAKVEPYGVNISAYKAYRIQKIYRSTGGYYEKSVF
ncbi:MAG: hypothetical protein LBG73_03990 [Spirochaetaceae bacterium]|jgi:hypothetical protein|nr:hypothetical protein [Spirochaetaceae bacterium]